MLEKYKYKEEEYNFSPFKHVITVNNNTGRLDVIIKCSDKDMAKKVTSLLNNEIYDEMERELLEENEESKAGDE